MTNLTKEKIFEAIAEDYYGADGFTPGTSVVLVSPEKLAAFLVEALSNKK